MAISRYNTVYITNNATTLKLKELHDAVYSDNLKKVDEIANLYPQLVNTVVTPIYTSVLSRAILKNHINYAMLELLLKHHVDLNIFVGADKMTPLDIASKNRDLKLCSFLINNKAVISPLTPHYLLSFATEVTYLNLENIKTLHQVIMLFGGLDHIAKMKNGNNESFKDCAKNSRLQNKFGGSMKYDLWNLLKLTQEVVLEEYLYKQSQQTIYSMINEEIIAPLSSIVMSYYLNSSSYELDTQLEHLVNQFSKKTKTDQQKLGQSYSFFKMGDKIIPEYLVPRNIVQNNDVESARSDLAFEQRLQLKIL